jgi:surfactin synthase thioesterase subunit
MLSHASGSAYHYVEAYRELADKVKLLPLELSGHGKRRLDRLLYTLDEIVEDLFVQAKKHLGEGEDKDYYIFGHSMGALNAFLLSTRMVKAGIKAPKRLFVSSYSVPGWHPIPKGMTLLSNLDMWRLSAERFGVLNNEPIPTEEQMELFSEVYRADLISVENFKGLDPVPVLDALITAVFAENDMVDYNLVKDWRNFTSRDLEIIMVEGGHFHPLERPLQLEKIILERL